MLEAENVCMEPVIETDQFDVCEVCRVESKREASREMNTAVLLQSEQIYPPSSITPPLHITQFYT